MAALASIDELNQLQAELGPFGFQWLCACALLPVLQYRLSVDLGNVLASAATRPQPDEDEKRYLFQHDWFRQGWIPRAERVELVRRLDPVFAPALRGKIAGMLDDAPIDAAVTGNELRVARQGTDQAVAGDGDLLLASFMVGASPPKDAFALGPAFARRLKLGLNRWPGRELARLIGRGSLTLGAGLLVALLVFQPEWFTVIEERRTIAARVVPKAAAPVQAPASGIAIGAAAAEAVLAAREWKSVRTINVGSWVWSAAFSPDGMELLTGSGDYNVEVNGARVWNTTSGAELMRLYGHTGWVRSVAFSSNGKRILTGSDDFSARLWESVGGKEIQRFYGHTGYVYSVAFSADSTRALTGSADHTARLWDAASGKELRRFEGHTGAIRAIAVFRGGTRLLTGSEDGTARLWDMTSGKEIRRFLGHTGMIVGVAFSPDGKRVLTGCEDKTARLWDAVSGKEIRRFEGHKGWVHSVAFSPSGAMVLTGSEDTTARLWETASGKELRRLMGHTDQVRSVAFSPDGTRVLTGSLDHTVRIWASILTPAPEARRGKPQ